MNNHQEKYFDKYILYTYSLNEKHLDTPAPSAIYIYRNFASSTLLL